MNLRRRALGTYRADSARSPRAPRDPSQIQFWKIIGRLKFSVECPRTQPKSAASPQSLRRRSPRRSIAASAGIRRRDRERSEQYAWVASAQRHIRECPDRQRHQLLCKRRMHRIEHRRRHDRLKHLPCGRHIMHFIEIEFFRCRHADQKREVRGEEDDDSGNSVP